MSTKSKPLAKRTQGLEASAVAEMKGLGQQLAEEGREIIPLVQGEPDFDTPTHISQAAMEALRNGRTHYVPTQGLMSLREAVAEKLKRENNIDANPATEVIITAGATIGLHLVMLTILDEGDEVLLPDPAYGPFKSIVTLSGGVYKFIPMEEDDGHFVLTEEAIESVITPRTKAIIVCSPNNPTGNVLSKEELEAAARVAEKHDLFIISDEVYEKLVYDGHEHLSILALAPHLKSQIIVVNAFSKSYAMTGWRLGYNVASPEIISTMSKVHQFTGRMPAAFVQHAGIAALKGPQDIISEMIGSYKARREMIVAGLQDVPGVVCPRPEGTFYAFIDARETGQDSWNLARHLLRTGGVITTPGDHYGPNGEGRLRISYACDTDQLARGLEGLRVGFEGL